MRVLSPAPRDLWEQAVREDPRACADHTPQWTDAAAVDGWSDASRAYVADDGTAVVLPLLRRRGRLLSMPPGWGYGGPVGAAAHDGTTVRRIADDLRALRAVTVRVRPLPEDGTVWRLPGATLVERHAHVVDLTPSVEDLRAGLRSSVRRSVRLCERDGVEVQVGATPELVEAYVGLWRLSVDRWARGQSEPLWLSRRRAELRDPPRRMHALARHLGDRFRLWVASVDGVPVAADVVLLGAVAHATRAAVDVERAPNGVSHYLDWLAMLDAKEQGASAMNLGESGTSSSLAFYKKGLGAVGLDYAEARFEQLPLTAVDRAARNAVKRLIGFEG